MKTITPEQQHANFLQFAVEQPVIEPIPDLPEITPDNYESRYDGLPPDYNPEFDYDDSIPIDFIDNPEPPPIGNNRAGKKAERERLQAEHDRKQFFTGIGELTAKPTPTDWQIKGYFERDKTVLVYGASGVGKSFVIVDMGLSIATGKEWQGHSTKQGAVFYICGEGKSGIKKRCMAWSIKNNVQLDNVPFFVSDSAVILPSKNAIEQLHTDIKNSGHIPTLIIFDTLARCLDGDENQAKDIGAFIQSVDSIRTTYNCTILIVHHSGKDEKKGARGSTSIKGALDTEILLSKTGEKSFELSVSKQKDHEPPKAKGFRFESVATNWLDDDMNVIYSAVLVSYETEHEKKARKLNANTQKMLNVLRTITDGGESCPQSVLDLFTDSPEQAPEKVVTVDNWQKSAYEVMTVISKANGITDEKEQEKAKRDELRKAFSRGLNDLEKSGYIGLFGDFVWCAYIPI
jgi:RecA-family ATPase